MPILYGTISQFEREISELEKLSQTDKVRRELIILYTEIKRRHNLERKNTARAIETVCAMDEVTDEEKDEVRTKLGNRIAILDEQISVIDTRLELLEQ